MQPIQTLSPKIEEINIRITVRLSILTISNNKLGFVLLVKEAIILLCSISLPSWDLVLFTAAFWRDQCLDIR